ncbi:uncharacterized protein BCR38DRAFT_348541, partial [Pseudomassariella vexata]
LVFQQGNTSDYSARVILDHIKELDIECLRWPAKSLDLSYIENIWFWMKVWLYQLLTPDELANAIRAAWAAVPEELLCKLATSMPDRLRKMLEEIAA